MLEDHLLIGCHFHLSPLNARRRGLMTDLIKKMRESAQGDDWHYMACLLEESAKKLECVDMAIRSTASQGTFDELAIRKAVGFELAEMILACRETMHSMRR